MPRLLFVHAHPDDETLTCGIAMAHHVARGDEVHVLTCTLGEEGEVIPPGLAHLEGDPHDRLGPLRHGELTRALSRIGVVGHVLGADAGGEAGAARAGRLSRYRDSGMAGSPAAARPEAFASADLDVVGALVADVVRELRPDVVVTYDEHGGYGHPDHIQAHRATRRALQLLEAESLPRLTYEILTPVGWAREDREWLRAADPALLDTAGWWAQQDLGEGSPEAPRLVVPSPDDPFPPSVVDDDLVTHVVTDDAARAVKNDALRAHATQVIVASEDVHALSNLVAARTTAREGFRQVEPRTWQPTGRRGTDLLT